MTFRWTDDLSTGIINIDIQHKTLIKQINVLLDACGRERGYEEIDRFLRFLAGYVRIHFADEETIMARCAYPGLEAHQRLHGEFRRRVESIRDDYQSHAAKEKAVADACALAAEWLREHISRDDAAMAQFVRRKS